MSLPPWSSCSNLSAHKSCSKLLLKGRRRQPRPAHLHNHHHHCKQPTGHNPAEKSNFTPTHKITPRPRIGLLAGAPMVVDFLPASWAGSRHSLLTLCCCSGSVAGPESTATRAEPPGEQPPLPPPSTLKYWTLFCLWVIQSRKV